MNLQEILDYRSNCIHCDRPLVMHIDGYPKLFIEQHADKLTIKSNKPNGVYLNFNYDGTYERNKRTYEIHKRPIYIRKYCHFHMPLSLKGEFQGTTINDLKEISCCYNFSLQGIGNTYVAYMEYEGACWHNDIEFWALDTFYPEKVTHIYRGFYSKTIGDMLHLELPIMNISSSKNQAHLHDRIKLYTTFS